MIKRILQVFHVLFNGTKELEIRSIERGLEVGYSGGFEVGYRQGVNRAKVDLRDSVVDDTYEECCLAICSELMNIEITEDVAGGQQCRVHPLTKRVAANSLHKKLIGKPIGDNKFYNDRRRFSSRFYCNEKNQ